MEIRRTAGILLLNSRNEILLQLRDNSPGIPYPRHWTTLGGQLEPGESPEDGIRRELQEEIGYAVEAPRLFRVYHHTDEDGERRTWVFYAPFDAPVERITLTEGERIEYMTIAEALQRPLAFGLGEVLRDFARALRCLDLSGGTP